MHLHLRAPPLTDWPGRSRLGKASETGDTSVRLVGNWAISGRLQVPGIRGRRADRSYGASEAVMRVGRNGSAAIPASTRRS